ncbi:MAG TPA: methyltransferase domain-containing protein [Polyangia bacterium]
MGSPSDPRFWREHWAQPKQGWEIGRAAPPLERWFAAHPPTGKRALVVGCGRGHEARMLASCGAEVVAIDFAPEALDEARALALQEGVRVDFRLRDLFALRGDPERYQLCVEHCCFCAIDPARRGEYVDVVADLLVDDGEFVGLLRTRCQRPDGPPFAVDAAEVERLFAPRFSIEHVSVPEDSIASRLGTELLVHMKRRR